MKSEANHIIALPHSFDDGFCARATIGLVVLASDQTIEPEFRELLNVPGVAVYMNRIYNDNEVTPATLKAMTGRITQTVDDILPDMPLTVVAYGCTSASMEIGEHKVFELIRKARPDVACTTPVTAASAALNSFAVKRIALVTPYRQDINKHLREHFEQQGYDVVAMGSFNEDDDRRVGRISPESVKAAAIELGSAKDVEAVFISCTAIRFAAIVKEVEQTLNKPATSSNHAMAWHCLRLAGVKDKFPKHGSLYTL